MNPVQLKTATGEEFTIDADDYARVSAFRWRVVHRRYGTRYLQTHAGGASVMLHRFIVGDVPAGLVVDHINGDWRDNRKSNLRVCHQRDNARNRRCSPKSKSGFKGVQWRKDIGKWRARIMVNRREITLGVFDDIRAAVAAYDAAAIEHFGAFARLNSDAAA